jgi:hypothetical protein
VITIGDIFHDEDILFGPCLIRAYDFERKRAKLPEIVVDEALIQRALDIASDALNDVIYG